MAATSSGSTSESDVSALIERIALQYNTAASIDDTNDTNNKISKSSSLIGTSNSSVHQISLLSNDEFRQFALPKLLSLVSQLPLQRLVSTLAVTHIHHIDWCLSHFFALVCCVRGVLALLVDVFTHRASTDLIVILTLTLTLSPHIPKLLCFKFSTQQQTGR